MERQVAWEELTLRVQSPNLLRFSLAVEAIMRALALKQNEEPDQWGLAGLLHAIDVERTRDEPALRGVLATEILENLEADPTIIHAVASSHDETRRPRRRAIDKALPIARVAADLLLGAALDHPEKCLGVLSVEGLLKRHEALRAEGDKKRRVMETADALGLSVPQIYELSLGAMMAIEDELGL